MVANEIRKRFPEDAANVANAFECLFPHTMLGSDATRMAFGLDQFETLCNAFKVLLPNTDGPIEEYQMFKSYVLNHWRALGPADFTRVALNNHFVRTSCPTSHKLLLIAATLPMTSVECERYFSVMKRVKTDSRNRLSVPATSALSITATDADSVENFSPSACVVEWQERKKRKREAELQAWDALEVATVSMT